LLGECDEARDINIAELMLGEVEGPTGRFDSCRQNRRGWRS